MNEDKSEKKKKKIEKDIPTSSKEKVEAKQKPKARLKKKKYPIVLVGKNYIVYKTKDRGNVWVRTSEASNYKVLGEYEV